VKPLCRPCDLSATPFIAFVVWFLFVCHATAQTPEHYRGRLSRLPVDYSSTNLITGQGVVQASLLQNELRVSVKFEGISSEITSIHVHRASKGLRGPIEFILDFPSIAGTYGTFITSVLLTEEQILDLRSERHYLQIHTKRNPAGELRGWLLPQT